MAPVWASYTAMDADGVWWWYEQAPVQDSYSWDVSYPADRSWPVNVPTNDWRNSLERRP